MTTKYEPWWRRGELAKVNKRPDSDITWVEDQMRYSNSRRRDMAKKIRDFLDIPSKLPVRKYTKAELALMHQERLLNNLKEHVRWLSLIHTWNLQSPNMPSCWYVNL